MTNPLSIAREALYRLRNECDIDGLRTRVGFDCWLAMADEALAALDAEISNSVTRNYRATDAAQQQSLLQKAFNKINSYIKTGKLQGNGWDETAQRNGLILASNMLSDMIDEEAQQEPVAYLHEWRNGTRRTLSFKPERPKGAAPDHLVTALRRDTQAQPTHIENAENYARSDDMYRKEGVPIHVAEPAFYISNDAKLPLTEDGSYWLYPTPGDCLVPCYTTPPAQPVTPPQGQLISVDVADNNEHGTHRIFARLNGEWQQESSGESTWFADEESRNFSAAQPVLIDPSWLKPGAVVPINGETIATLLKALRTLCVAQPAISDEEKIGLQKAASLSVNGMDITAEDAPHIVIEKYRAGIRALLSAQEKK